MIKILLIVKEDCPACTIVKRVITEAINKINCNLTFKIVTHCNTGNVKVFPTTIFYKNVGDIDLLTPVYKEIARLEGSFPIDYLNNVIDKLKFENNE